MSDSLCFCIDDLVLIFLSRVCDRLLCSDLFVPNLCVPNTNNTKNDCASWKKYLTIYYNLGWHFTDATTISTGKRDTYMYIVLYYVCL